MNAIILAAGRGTRLGALADGRPKACLEIGGQSLIERALALFRRHGVTHTYIVTGFQAGYMHKRFAAPDVTLVWNPFYATTNTLPSLWFGLSAVEGECVMLNGDTIFAEEILLRVLAAKGDLLLSCDRKRCGEEEVKYRSQEGRIIALGKEIPINEAEGEFMGLSRVSARALPRLKESLRTLLEAGQFGAYFEAAFVELIKSGEVAVLPVQVDDLPWTEIDFPADFERAQNLFGSGRLAEDSTPEPVPASGSISVAG